MRNKLRVLSLGLLLLGGAALVGCDTVEAKLPEAQQSEKILNLDLDLPHNNIEELFEAVVPNDSSTAGKVLESLLYRLAQSTYGSFYGDDGLRAVVSQGDDAIATFVNGHSAFQVKDASGNRVAAKEVAGVKAFYDHVIVALQKSFWNGVNSSTYQDRYQFSEKKFYDAQEASMYNLDDAYGELLEDNPNLMPLDGTKDYRSVEEYFGSADNNVSYLDVYKDYIERALLPDVYRKAIVESYLRTQNSSALGRSHARKIQAITLKNLSDSVDATQNLATIYAKNILAKTDDEVRTYFTLDVADKVSEIRDLHFLSRLYAGIVSDDPATMEGKVAAKVYEDAGWETVTNVINGENVTYCPLTTMGKIYKDYTELATNRWESGSSTDFTGGGAYTKETGLMLKEREIVSQSNVTEGWYTSSTLSALPSELRSRLFKIQVANEVDNNYITNDDGSLTPIPNQTNKEGLKYGHYVQGSYYLTPEKYASTATPYLIYDSSSTSWVIVRVDEAVKGAKFSEDDDSTSSYDYLAEKGLRDGKEGQLDIVYTVANMLADSDTYVKAARQAVLKKANLVYHDQNVYDYFESNFPDLFN